jgi:hypothetical protein
LEEYKISSEITEEEPDDFFKIIENDIKVEFKKQASFATPINVSNKAHNLQCDVVIYTPKTFKIIPVDILSRSTPYHFDAKLLKTEAKFEDFKAWKATDDMFVILNTKCQGYKKTSSDFNRESTIERLGEIAKLITDDKWKQVGINVIKDSYNKAQTG